eukprot:2489790-Lingulodinium_polyedra.AAC.1
MDRVVDLYSRSQAFSVAVADGARLCHFRSVAGCAGRRWPARGTRGATRARCSWGVFCRVVLARA